MLFQSNGTQKYLRNNKIMSNMSRDTTIVVFCWPSVILQLQCVLYFQVCSIFRPFLCAMNINESVISITSPRSRHGKLTVRSNERYLYKIWSRITCWHVVDMSGFFLTSMSTWKKDLDDSPIRNHWINGCKSLILGHSRSTVGTMQ